MRFKLRAFIHLILLTLSIGVVCGVIAGSLCYAAMRTTP